MQPVPDYASSTGGPGGTATPPEGHTPVRSRTSTPTPSIRTGSSSIKAKDKNKGWLRKWLPNRRTSSDDNAEPVEVPETYAPHANYARAWRRPVPHPLPDVLGPSLAWTETPCGVISSFDRPGEMPLMEWTKSMRVKGLGKVDIGLFSAYVSRDGLRREREGGLTALVCVWIGS